MTRPFERISPRIWEFAIEILTRDPSISPRNQDSRSGRSFGREFSISLVKPSSRSIYLFSVHNRRKWREIFRGKRIGCVSVGLSSELRHVARFASFVVDEKKEGNYIPMHTARRVIIITSPRFETINRLSSFCLRLWVGRKPKNNGVAGVDHT